MNIEQQCVASSKRHAILHTVGLRVDSRDDWSPSSEGSADLTLLLVCGVGFGRHIALAINR